MIAAFVYALALLLSAITQTRTRTAAFSHAPVGFSFG